MEHGASQSLTAAPESPARWHRLAPVATIAWMLLGSFGLAGALAGCHGETTRTEPSAAPFRRVLVEAQGPTRSRDAVELLGTLRASDSPLPWAGTASGGVQQVEVSAPSGSKVAATELLGLDGLKYVRGKVPEAARAFNQVTIEVTTPAVPKIHGAQNEQARLYLYAGGEKLMGAILCELERHGDMQVATFRSALLRGEYVVPDEFAVAFIGRLDSAKLASVTFSRVSDEAFAPPLGQQEGEALPLVHVGTTARRSYGVIGSRPLRTSVTLGTGEEFRAYLALVPKTARPSEQAMFQVSAVGPTGEWKGKFESVGTDRWRPVVIAADHVGAGAVEIEVALTSTIGDDAAIGAFAEPSVRAAKPTGAPPPTVLLITSDTHRADHIGVASADGLVSTPHIDALARRGIHFLDCVAPTNVTAPSHIALMTGMHVRDTGILTNRDVLSAEASTIATRFRDAGYETLAATSVFHLSQAQSGIGHGFDRIDAPLEGDRPGPEAIALMADWIEEAKNAPVFCWVHLYDAHAPYSPPKPYDRKYWDGGDPFRGKVIDTGEAKIPSWIRGLSDRRFPYSQYRAEVDFVDGALGELLDLPRVRSGVTAFTADHGELFGEHGIWWSHSGLYPGIMRIPLVMAWPGAPAGARVRAPVNLMDVGRTLAEVSGLGSPDMPGSDLRSFLEAEPPKEPRFFLGAHHFLAAIEADGWFLTMTLIGHQSSSMAFAREPGEVELYHLESDPNGEHDVLLEELDRARVLRRRLIRWLEDAPRERLNGTAAEADGDAADAMLAALGYSGGQSVEGEAYWDPLTADSNWATNPWHLILDADDVSRSEAAELLAR
ncbi:Arylsulfatase [Planctomycetes bacterium Poly30]|uniref:Arylsulfatase n=1 Tax=Saltatorellus ferox TaxID=2528018 RepID=A0A518EV19_9BACT|nr:Arylsulfatase [Planctomycetes bacterium Poly30]